jgi:hypothetical protein
MSDLFSLNDIQQSPNFGIKRFKDGYYMGELDPETNMR